MTSNFHEHAIAHYKTCLDARDQVALNVSWAPVRVGGSFFKNRRLEVNSTRAVIRLWVPGVVGTIVALIIARAARFWVILGFTAVVPSIFNWLFGGGFQWVYDAIAAGFVALLYFYSSASGLVTFDKATGMYFIRNTLLAGINRRKKGKMSEIYAIQIVKEVIETRDEDFISVELNLVFSSGERQNLMDHGKEDDIATDAETLSKFLNVPVWEISQMTFAGARLAG